MNEITADPNGQSRAVVPFNDQLKEQEAEWGKILPAHVSLERFRKVIITAINQNPALWKKATPRSFWSACSKAATDGLYPDGREAAFVMFGNVVQYMPMIAGIRKLVRNSKEIATWEATLVYENEVRLGLFKLVGGDEPRIYHEPIVMGERGPIVAAYSVARLKSGEISREFMTIEQMDKVRDVSRSKGSGPWTQWPEEMYRKTVLRRHSKALPMSTDLEEVFAHDDAATFSTAEPQAVEERIASPSDINGRLDRLAGPIAREEDEEHEEHDDIDPDTGEVATKAEKKAETSTEQSNSPGASPTTPQPPVEASEATETPPVSPSSSQTLGPDADTDTASEAPLSLAAVERLKVLHNAAGSAMTSGRLAARISAYREQYQPTGHEDRVVGVIGDAHKKRIKGESSPADCDNLFRQAVMFASSS